MKYIDKRESYTLKVYNFLLFEYGIRRERRVRTVKPKTVNYHFLDSENPSAAKIFQDKSSQIRGIFFAKEYIDIIKEQKYATNYAIYFLINKDKKENKIYVGQSRVGVNRIFNHCRNKDFWTHCIMFVADNNVFDANVIDYLEYYFINLLGRANNYTKVNVEKREREPNINYFDKLTYQMFIEQIEFMLKAEGISPNIQERERSEEVEEQKESEEELYEFEGSSYSGKLKVEQEKYIILKGSVIEKPKSSMMEWQDKGAAYCRLTKRNNKLIEEGKLKGIGMSCSCEVLSDIEFTSPSGAATFVRGRPANGWEFFKGLDNRRRAEKKK